MVDFKFVVSLGMFWQEAVVLNINLENAVAKIQCYALAFMDKAKVIKARSIQLSNFCVRRARSLVWKMGRQDEMPMIALLRIGNREEIWKMRSQKVMSRRLVENLSRDVSKRASRRTANSWKDWACYPNRPVREDAQWTVVWVSTNRAECVEGTCSRPFTGRKKTGAAYFPRDRFLLLKRQVSSVLLFTIMSSKLKKKTSAPSQRSQ